MSKQIPLTRGKFAIVDDEDYPYLSRFKWIVDSNNNVFLDFFDYGTKYPVHIQMWKFIIGREVGKKMVYKNKNSLDNSKENLSLESISSANAYAGKRKKYNKRGKPTSKYKGVCFVKKKQGKKHWRMCITKNGNDYVKQFYTEKEAALEYNKKAKELYGEFAYQNKIV